MAWLSGLMWPIQDPSRKYKSLTLFMFFIANDEIINPPSVHICRSTVWLSTAPTEPLTRWYQVRCLLQTPLFVKLGQTLSGTVLLAANNRYTWSPPEAKKVPLMSVLRTKSSLNNSNVWKGIMVIAYFNNFHFKCAPITILTSSLHQAMTCCLLFPFFNSWWNWLPNEGYEIV